MFTQHLPASHPAPSWFRFRPEFFAQFEFGFSLDSSNFIPSGSTSSFQSAFSDETIATAHVCRPDVFVRTACSPVGENEVAPVVTTPAASGPRAGIQSALMSSMGLVCCSAGAVRKARSFQVSIKPDSLIPSLIAPLITMYASQHAPIVPMSSAAAMSKPRRVNSIAKSFGIVAPAVSGLTVKPVRFSNLDCQNRLVKRGVKVSYQGVRGLVKRVNRGHCCVAYIDYLGRFTGSVEWLKCESLQVVA